MPAPIGRAHHVVLDARDPRDLADFYAALLGLEVTYADADWVVVASAPDVSGFAFQRAPDHQPPVWGDPDHPQQWHLDVMVEDVGAAEERVTALGAARLVSPEGSVWADPAGHPFCLVPRPGWAPAIGT